MPDHPNPIAALRAAEEALANPPNCMCEYGYYDDPPCPLCKRQSAALALVRAALAAVPEPRCTCGSGAHPRRCAKHPEEYDRHCAELNREWQEEPTAEATNEKTGGN